ncbi:hypothetical protein RB195_003962 [Necator americanus]|uniref:Uncharacterized protein n=1 Tax=Necator americanus TaxID=51031 RepID=A0ABR1DR78_NECAM
MGDYGKGGNIFYYTDARSSWRDHCSERGVDFGSMQGPVQENRTLQGSFLGDGDMTTANANNSFTAVAVETETILKVKRNAKEPA